jgi:hypothetical protein
VLHVAAGMRQLMQAPDGCPQAELHLVSQPHFETHPAHEPQTPSNLPSLYSTPKHLPYTSVHALVMQLL